MIYIEQWAMIGVEIRTRRRMQARRTQTLAAPVDIAPVHGVHIGRRAAEIAYISLEIRHTRDLPDLAQYRLRRARGYKLALMSRDGAESATAEAAAMEVYRMTYHLIGRYCLAFISGMGQTGIGQVDRKSTL